MRIVDEVDDDAVREIGFVVERSGRDVPAVLFRPANGPATGVVLLGHGGSGHKRSERIVRVARWFAEHAGFVALAIDGPSHGDRATPGTAVSDYQRLIVRQGAEVVHEQMRQDWEAALAAADHRGWSAGQDVAYLGMSMGARYGLAACAALGSRLRCVVVGKFGLRQSALLPRELAADDVIVAAAERIDVPVLQHVQWHDELFPREGQLELFDLFPSPHNVLHVRPGTHAIIRPDDQLAWRTHVVAHLADH